MPKNDTDMYKLKINIEKINGDVRLLSGRINDHIGATSSRIHDVQAALENVQAALKSVFDRHDDVRLEMVAHKKDFIEITQGLNKKTREAINMAHQASSDSISARQKAVRVLEESGKFNSKINWLLIAVGISALINGVFTGLAALK